MSARCFFMDTLSVPRDEFVSIQQTHGKNLRRITSLDRGRGALSYQDAFADTDGIYTNESHLFMATFYADCLPLAVFDPVHRGLGLAHAGWKGTYQNIGGALIDAMKEAFDSDPKDMFFAMGAGIMSCCYEVDKSFYRRFLDQYDGASQWFSPGCTPEKYMFDNIKANSDLAIKAGILKENMTSLNAAPVVTRRNFIPIVAVAVIAADMVCLPDYYNGNIEDGGLSFMGFSKKRVLSAFCCGVLCLILIVCGAGSDISRGLW